LAAIAGIGDAHPKRSPRAVAQWARLNCYVAVTAPTIALLHRFA
jgi:hypothetical protein